MDKQEFMSRLADILDCEEEFGMETELGELEEWDSLGILTFLAEMTDSNGNSLKADAVKAAETVADLYDLIV